MAQEAAVEQAIDRYVVQVDLCRYNTCLSFAAWQADEVHLAEGWIQRLVCRAQERYGLSDSVCYRLLQNIFSKDPRRTMRASSSSTAWTISRYSSAQEVYVQCFDHIQD
ncbi:MAG: hypothetical protein ACLVJ6_01145 [Merdibacter sp.]